MDKKEFVAKTVSELPNYNHEEQVEIFNEIKNALLCIRKEMHERNMSDIKGMTEHNQLIEQGNNSITGQSVMAVRASY